MPISLNDAYRHCQRCGTAIPADHNQHLSKCPRCGYVQHFNPITAVGVIIYDQQHEVLLIRRNRDPGKGKLGVPGGFVDLNETAEAAASREVFEEIGVSIQKFEFVATFPNRYIYQDVIVPVLDIFFAAQIDDVGSMNLAVDEVSEVGRFPLDDSTFSQMAFESNKLALQALHRKLAS